MRSNHSFLRLMTILALAAIFAAASAAQAATRDLVFDDEDETETTAAIQAAQTAGISNPEVISVKTTFDLTKDGGETVSVGSDHEFQSGEKIKLRYTVNADGYAYWLAKMSSGQYSLLFPSQEAGTDNFVQKNSNQTVPVKGYFRFDGTPGTEELLLVFSTSKIPELEQAVAEAAANNGVVAEQVAKVASLEQDPPRSRTRDLVFDDEDEEDVNTKTQAGEAGQPFVALYSLTHK